MDLVISEPMFWVEMTDILQWTSESPKEVSLSSFSWPTVVPAPNSDISHDQLFQTIEISIYFNLTAQKLN